MQLHSPSDTGGASILTYILVMDDGSANTDFSEVTSYSELGGASADLLAHTLTAADGLVPGEQRVYGFKFRATNGAGASEFSEVLRVALGSRQSAPANLSSDHSQNGASFVHVQWDRVNGELDTEGYSLEYLQDDDTWLEVFDARTNPDALDTVVHGLTPGKLYTFRAYSYNFNGASLPSSYLAIYACGSPSSFAEPLYVASSTSSITISWTAPLDDGGCPISDYEVQRDEDGTGLGAWTEVNPAGTFQRFDPYQDSFECSTFPDGS